MSTYSQWLHECPLLQTHVAGQLVAEVSSMHIVPARKCMLLRLFISIIYFYLFWPDVFISEFYASYFIYSTLFTKDLVP